MTPTLAGIPATGSTKLTPHQKAVLNSMSQPRKIYWLWHFGPAQGFKRGVTWRTFRDLVRLGYLKRWIQPSEPEDCRSLDWRAIGRYHAGYDKIRDHQIWSYEI